MLVTTEAIVLHSRKQGETSRIVVLYTRQFGKVSVVAKGVREMKSKFGGALEGFVRSTVVFYYKSERPGLYLLSKAETLDSHAKLLNTLEQIEAATSVVELIAAAMHDEEGNDAIFDLLSSTLDQLAAAPKEAVPAILFSFFMQFSHRSGFQLALRESDFVEQVDLAQVREFNTRIIFRVKTGEFVERIVQVEEPRGRNLAGLLSEVLRNDEVLVLPESLEALRGLETGSLEIAASIRLSQRAIDNLMEIFRAYFAEHVAGLTSRSLKSGRVFSAL